MSKKKKRRFYVYILRRPDWHDPYYVWKSKPFYVGKGSGGRANRHKVEALNYLNGSDVYNVFKVNIINYLLKNGLDLEIEYYAIDLTEEEAFELEIKLIAFYGRKDNKTGILANMTDGGEGNSGYIYTEEQRKQMSIRMSGENNPRFGKEITEENRKNLSLSHIGYIPNQETLLKQSEAGRKAWENEERREIMSQKKKEYWAIKIEDGTAYKYDKRVCEYCDNLFQIRGIQQEENRKFCSRECFLTYFKENIWDSEDFKETMREASKKVWIKRKEEEVFLKEIPRDCPICGSEFTSDDSDAIYCSRECVYKSMIKEPNKCEWCGGDFKRNSKKNKFCSTGCYHEYRREMLCQDEEYKIRQSESKKGQIPWNKGFPSSEETRQKQSEAKMGKKWSEESKEKKRQTIARNKAEKAERESQQFSLNLVSNG
jgi:hypothetical protein